MENRDMEVSNQVGSKKTFWFFFKKPLWWAARYMMACILAGILYVPALECFNFDQATYWYNVFIGFIAMETVCFSFTLLFLLVSLVVCLILAKIHKDEYDEFEESEEEITKENFWKELRSYCRTYLNELGIAVIVLMVLNVLGTFLYLWLAQKSISDIWFGFLGRTMIMVIYSFALLIIDVAVFVRKAKKHKPVQDI